MKHSILITTGMIAGLLFTSTGAFAASHGDSQRIQPQKHTVSHKNVQKTHKQNIRGVNVARLEQLIQTGVKRGSLTRGETRIARNGLNSLKSTIKVVLKDRKVTEWERNRVQKKNAQLTRTIKKLMNNKAVAKRTQHSRNYASR